jgi:DNA repair exonuclease SbcCD nuclease subunit
LHNSHVEWLDKTLKEKNVKDIVIAGDIFHNRHEIGVNTIQTAYKIFDILKDYNIVAITGNHDCYYKDKSDINSVAILNKQNIRVFEEITTFTEQNKKITFCIDSALKNRKMILVGTNEFDKKTSFFKL